MALDDHREDGPDEPPKFNHDTGRGWTEAKKPGDKKIYRGPIHKVTFPPPYLAFNEIDGWIALGYHAIGRGADVATDRTIRVYNWIDPAFKAVLEASGVTFETQEDGYYEI